MVGSRATQGCALVDQLPGCGDIALVYSILTCALRRVRRGNRDDQGNDRDDEKYTGPESEGAEHARASLLDAGHALGRFLVALQPDCPLPATPVQDRGGEQVVEISVPGSAFLPRRRRDQPQDAGVATGQPLPQRAGLSGRAAGVFGEVGRRKGDLGSGRGDEMVEYVDGRLAILVGRSSSARST